MFVYTVITALLTSGWWAVPFPLNDEPSLLNASVGLLLTATVFYLIWLVLNLISEWEE